MAVASGSPAKKLAVNRRLLHDYHVESRFEAGIALTGTEVKSAKSGNIAIAGSYAAIDESGQVVLYNLDIAPYTSGNRFNHDPGRPRKLLLHRREIEKLRVKLEQRGYALIPCSVYLKRSLVKVEIGVCRGKRDYDKRETLRRKEMDRDIQRAVARRG